MYKCKPHQISVWHPESKFSCTNSAVNNKKPTLCGSTCKEKSDCCKCGGGWKIRKWTECEDKFARTKTGKEICKFLKPYCASPFVQQNCQATCGCLLGGTEGRKHPTETQFSQDPLTRKARPPVEARSSSSTEKRPQQSNVTPAGKTGN